MTEFEKVLISILLLIFKTQLSQVEITLTDSVGAAKFAVAIADIKKDFAKIEKVLIDLGY